MVKTNKVGRRKDVFAEGRGDGFEWTARVVSGKGARESVFHDCPLCRELVAESLRCGKGGTVEAVVGINPDYADQIPVEWIESLLELVGPNATVQLMGRNMEAEPVEELSMEQFLERVGYGA